MPCQLYCTVNYIALGGTFVPATHIFELTQWCSYLRHALQGGRLRVRFPMVSLEFFIDIIFPAAL